MSLTDERSLRSVIQIPGHTIAPPVPVGLSVGASDLMVVSYLYGGIAPSILLLPSISSDILDYNAFIYQAKDYDTSIDQSRDHGMSIYQTKDYDASNDQSRDHNAFIRRVEDYEVER